MIIDTGANQYEATNDNAVYMRYPNNMMNGLYVDMDDEYLFLSEHSEFFNTVITAALLQGIPTVEVSGYHAAEPPHCYVIASLGRFVASSAEEISDGTHTEDT